MIEEIRDSIEKSNEYAKRYDYAEAWRAIEDTLPLVDSLIEQCGMLNKALLEVTGVVDCLDSSIKDMNEKIKKYSMFIILCDREGLPLLDFDSFLELED